MLAALSDARPVECTFRSCHAQTSQDLMRAEGGFDKCRQFGEGHLRSVSQVHGRVGGDRHHHLRLRHLRQRRARRHQVAPLPPWGPALTSKAPLKGGGGGGGGGRGVVGWLEKHWMTKRGIAD